MILLFTRKTANLADLADGRGLDLSGTLILRLFSGHTVPSADLSGAAGGAAGTIGSATGGAAFAAAHRGGKGG